MNSWQSESFCNRWLRAQAKESPKHRSTLIISMQELSALESELETIQKYVNRTSTSRVKIEACRGEIKLSVVDSKEMFT